MRVDTLRVEIHSHGDNVHITGAFAVTEQRTLDAIGAGKDAEFRSSHATATVIVGMQANHDLFALRQVPTKILNLIGKHVGRRHFHGRR